MGRFDRWAPYVPVAQRRRNAEKEAQRLAKKGTVLNPLRISSRTIATTFWGKAWCENLENYCDEYNRMPRGRTYARNGSVVDLQVNKGKVTGLVSGSSLYKISIVIDPLSAKAWQKLCQDCSQEIVSLLDLMRGKLSNSVIERLTDAKDGLFPKTKEIHVACNCPDDARMCKHVAAVLYGVGHRLDSSPEMFFQLRGVDQSELVSQALSLQNSSDVMGLDQSSDFAAEDLGAIFGIDLAMTAADAHPPKPAKIRASRSSKPNGSEAGISPAAVPTRSTKKTTGKTVTSSTVTTAKKATPKKAKPKKLANGKSAVSSVAASKKIASKTTSQVDAPQRTEVARSTGKETSAISMKRKALAVPARKKGSSRMPANER